VQRVPPKPLRNHHKWKRGHDASDALDLRRSQDTSCGPGPGVLAHPRGAEKTPRSLAERAMGADKATLLYSSDADHVGDVAVVDAPISEGDTDATTTR
jgi:hypothetical protein